MNLITVVFLIFENSGFQIGQQEAPSNFLRHPRRSKVNFKHSLFSLLLAVIALNCHFQLKIAMQPNKISFSPKNGILKRLQPKVKKTNYASNSISHLLGCLKKFVGASFYPFQKPEFSKIKKNTVIKFKEHSSHFWANSLYLETLLTTCVLYNSFFFLGFFYTSVCKIQTLAICGREEYPWSFDLKS